MHLMNGFCLMAAGISSPQHKLNTELNLPVVPVDHPSHAAIVRLPYQLMLNDVIPT